MLLSKLIKFSVSLSVCHSVCVFHSGDFIFKAICNFFYLLEQALGSVLAKSEFKYVKLFLRKSKITAKGNVKMLQNQQFISSADIILKDIFKNSFHILG